jgi:hypothetical protein
LAAFFVGQYDIYNEISLKIKIYLKKVYQLSQGVTGVPIIFGTVKFSGG